MSLTGPDVKKSKLIFLTIWTWLNKACKLCMNNQLNATCSGEPLVKRLKHYFNYLTYQHVALSWSPTSCSSDLVLNEIFLPRLISLYICGFSLSIPTRQLGTFMENLISMTIYYWILRFFFVKVRFFFLTSDFMTRTRLDTIK